MEIKVVGLAAGGLKERQGFAPGIAFGFAAREIVERTEAHEIARGERGFARSHPPIAGQLSEPGAFRNDIHHSHLEAWSVLKGRPCQRAGFRDVLQRRAEKSD